MTKRIGTSQSQSWCRYLKNGALVLVLLLALPSAMRLLAQAPVEDEIALRNRAFLLWDQGNQTEALPLLEKLAVARPTDAMVLERLGGVLGGSAHQIADPAARKQVVLRARSILLRAKELGDNSGYLTIMLEQLPENGEIPAFSTRKEVDDALREGEAAFGKSDFAGAMAAYKRAFQLDPNSYAAALFTGDVYFNMNQMDKAAEWFATAIKIDPERETAYRYWGDALMKDGKMDEARSRFIDAVIVEPYIRTSWVGLERWAGRNNAKLSHPKIEPPGSVSAQGDQTIINIDPAALDKKDGSQYWVIYPMSRALWRGEQFKKEFPNEKSYRHTLREEVEALGTVADAVSEDGKKPRKSKKLDPALLTLLNLRDQGLLEAFVLLSRPDEGIVKDYAAYRAAHRDKLVRYISEWLISTGGTKK